MAKRSKDSNYALALKVSEKTETSLQTHSLPSKRKQPNSDRVLRSCKKKLLNPEQTTQEVTQQDKPNPLLTIEDPLLEATVLRRPSSRNKSPFVIDIKLGTRECIAHAPSLDLGGKCIPGSKVFVKPARDPQGNLVGPDAVGKYNTPKCEYICQLVHVSEPENEPEGTYVGAHPSLGEKLASQLLKPGSSVPFFHSEPKVIKQVKKEVSNIAGCDMRSDFLLEFTDGSACVVEVKTVPDSDRNPELYSIEELESSQPLLARAAYFSKKKPYVRSAIFPWGGGKQKGPDGEKVVSARAIKHISELTKIAKGTKKETSYPRIESAVLFIIARNDVEQFRPNHEACPTFAKYLKKARDNGVKVAAVKFKYELEKVSSGYKCSVCFEGQIPIDWSYC